MRGWFRERFRTLADKAADHLLWLIVIFLAGSGGTLFGLVRGALEHRTLLIVVGGLIAGVAVALFLIGLIGRVVTRLRQLEFEYVNAEYEKQLLYEVLESIQEAIATEESWELDDLVEKGILGPVRGLLTRAPLEDVRLAVLVPCDDDSDHFRMRWAAGHRPMSVRQYRRPVADTMAGLAFSSGSFVQSGDVQKDPRFVPNPKETRPFHSLVAVPLRFGNETVGVLSVVSTLNDAFAPSDIAFVKTIGAVMDVVLAVERDATRWRG